MSITQVISDLSTAPSRADPANFDSRADTFLSEMEDIPTEVNAWATEANALAVTVNGYESAAATSVTEAEDQVALAEAAAVESIASSGATEYSASVTYDYPDTVVCTDGHTYRCIGTSVIGDNPVTSTSGDWVQITTEFVVIKSASIHFLRG